MRVVPAFLNSLPLLWALMAFAPASHALRFTEKQPPHLVSVSQTLAKMRNNSAYFRALVAAKIETLLDSPALPYASQFTVFAPTNAAFEQLKSRGLADLFDKGQERKLQSVISFSVVSDAKPLMTLRDAQLLRTMHGNSNLRVMQHNGQTWLTGGTPEPLELRARPILCDNGAIYVIDEVLVPLARREVPATK